MMRVDAIDSPAATPSVDEVLPHLILDAIDQKEGLQVLQIDISTMEASPVRALKRLLKDKRELRVTQIRLNAEISVTVRFLQEVLPRTFEGGTNIRWSLFATIPVTQLTTHLLMVPTIPPAASPLQPPQAYSC